MVPSTWPDLGVPIMQLSPTLSWPSKKQAEAIRDVANQLLGPEGNGQGRRGFGNGLGRKAAGCRNIPMVHAPVIGWRAWGYGTSRAGARDWAESFSRRLKK